MRLISESELPSRLPRARIAAVTAAALAQDVLARALELEPSQ